MELNSNFRKRRLLEDTVSSSNSPTGKRDVSTSTICQKPMTFDMWTQTDVKEEFPSTSTSKNFESKLNKIFNILSRHSHILKEIQDTIEDHVVKDKHSIDDDKNSSTNTNYKIIANGDDGITIEPIQTNNSTSEHDLTSTNVTYFGHEIEEPRKEKPATVTTTKNSDSNNIILNPLCRIDNYAASNLISAKIIETLKSEVYAETSNQSDHDHQPITPATSSSNRSFRKEIENSSTETFPALPAMTPQEVEMVPIGSNGTTVPKTVLESIKWDTASSATRRLLSYVFSREVLATHSLTGRPSPAFYGREKPLKNQLDPAKVMDIIQIVSKCCNVSEKEVRNAITTKCADENKMYNQRMRKQLIKRDKENIRTATTN